MKTFQSYTKFPIIFSCQIEHNNNLFIKQQFNKTNNYLNKNILLNVFIYLFNVKYSWHLNTNCSMNYTL